jgi:hypothetical protein
MENQIKIIKELLALKNDRKEADDALLELLNKFEKKIIISAIELPNLRIANAGSDFDFVYQDAQDWISELASIEFSIEKKLAKSSTAGEVCEFKTIPMICFKSIGENSHEQALIANFSFKGHKPGGDYGYPAFTGMDYMNNNYIIYFEKNDDFTNIHEEIMANVRELNDLMDQFEQI